MYAPPNLGQPTAALTPVSIVSSAPESAAPPARTALKVTSSRLDVLGGQRASVAGLLVQKTPRLALAGDVVALQELSSRGWRTLAHTRTRADGRFRITYAAHTEESVKVRLFFAGVATDAHAGHQLGRLNVYRVAEASWYGGGGSLACGGWLTSSTLGVANKTLPCGTMITLRYAGHTVRVPVIDRGPYVEGRELDLTEATKQALGFGDTGQVWMAA